MYDWMESALAIVQTNRFELWRYFRVFRPTGNGQLKCTRVGVLTVSRKPQSETRSAITGKTVITRSRRGEPSMSNEAFSRRRFWLHCNPRHRPTNEVSTGTCECGLIEVAPVGGSYDGSWRGPDQTPGGTGRRDRGVGAGRGSRAVRPNQKHLDEGSIERVYWHYERLSHCAK